MGRAFSRTFRAAGADASGGGVGSPVGCRLAAQPSCSVVLHWITSFVKDLLARGLYDPPASLVIP